VLAELEAALLDGAIGFCGPEWSFGMNL